MSVCVSVSKCASDMSECASDMSECASDMRLTDRLGVLKIEGLIKIEH